MISRVGLAAIALALAAAVAVAPAARQPPSETALYVVRVDPRLCPSPMCGGYWVALANAARTRCQDGLRHARCYVATAVGPQGQAVAAIRDHALVRGAIDIGRDDYGELVARAVYAPVGTGPARGGYYRVVDTGVRCVREPCFSWRVTQVNGATASRVSDVDLAAAGASAAEVARAQPALRTKNGLYARGRFSTALDGGRTFHAFRLYLRAPLLRA